MPLIKNDTLIEDDWLTIEDGEALPEDASPVISMERWLDERDSLIGRNGPLGIRLRSDQSPAEIAADLGRFDMIALEFPKFTDGRAYSYARLLRERYGFDREIRAVGNVLRDQWVFMLRCGFNAIEAADEADIRAWHEAKREISVVYQPGSDRQRPALALRTAHEGNEKECGGSEPEAPTRPWRASQVRFEDHARIAL